MSCSNKFHILEIQDLSISFRQYEKGIRQVDLPVISRLNVTVHEGEIVAVVGSSGSGKSLLAHAILGLLPSNAMCSGEFFFLQEPLTPERMEKLRGKEIALVPQSVTYLDPLMKVGKQVRRGRRDRETVSRQRELFSQYGLAQEVEEKYPFACSGGMSRRILLATALMENPRLIIADEPTTALDVTVQAQVLELLQGLQDELNTSILLITHNLGVVWKMCDTVMVMYAGKTVEYADTKTLYAQPMHPYTWGLLDSIPKLSDKVKGELKTIPGVPPDLRLTGKCCNFYNRCPYAQEICSKEVPELAELEPGHFVACHRQNGEKKTGERRGESQWMKRK